MDSFAFIIHPLRIDDFTRKFSWMKGIPNNIIEKVTRFIPPFKVSRIEGIKSPLGKEIEGYFVACPLSSEQILELPQSTVLDKIIKAGEIAEKLGAQIVGLGSFTSVVADKGITVANNLDIPVTTGNSYTVATAVQGTRLAVRKMGLDLEEENITIIGASGSIGRAISLLMAGKTGGELQLVARNQQRLRDLQKELKQRSPRLRVNFTDDVEQALANSRIVISASGAVESLISPRQIQPGTVICDVARPRDVAHKVGKARDDVLVIEGGIVEVPGPVDFNFNFGCPPKTAYACMAETMMLTLEGSFVDFSLGPEIELEKVEKMMGLARKHGFSLAGLRSFGKLLSEEKIERIKQKAFAKSERVLSV